MRHSILAFAFVAFVAMAGFGFFSETAHARPGSGSGGGAGLVRVEGIVTSINLATRQIVLRTSTGAFFTVQTAATTKFERNGLHVTINRFKVGDRGQARILSNRIAAKFEARGR